MEGTDGKGLAPGAFGSTQGPRTALQASVTRGGFGAAFAGSLDASNPVKPRHPQHSRQQPGLGWPDRSPFVPSVRFTQRTRGARLRSDTGSAARSRKQGRIPGSLRGYLSRYTPPRQQPPGGATERAAGDVAGEGPPCPERCQWEGAMQMTGVAWRRGGRRGAERRWRCGGWWSSGSGSGSSALRSHEVQGERPTGQGWALRVSRACQLSLRGRSPHGEAVGSGLPSAPLSLQGRRLQPMAPGVGRPHLPSPAALCSLQA